MISLLKVPPPPPYMKIKKGEITPSPDSLTSQPSPSQPSPSQPSPSQPVPSQPERQVSDKKTTEQILSDTISSLRLPKINREWKKCISEIEKVIDKQPSHEEYNDPSMRKRIEYYKDRLGRDLYECKINLKKKESEDELYEKRKREKAQEEFDRRFEMKYNLKPQQPQRPGQQPQSQPQPSQQPQQPQQPQPSQLRQPQPAFGLEMEQGMENKPGGPLHKEEKEGKKKEGFFESIFGKKEEEEEEEEDTREEMIDAINLYLRSQDPSMPQSINISDVKGIDNLIERYKELIENHDNLENRFQKYRESQKIKNVKDTSLINEKRETIENLTSVIMKLEKGLKEYRKNAEKKFIAQDELHKEDIKTMAKEKDQESRNIHKYMQDILNERIDTANKVITGLSEETEEVMKHEKKKKKTKSKSKTKSKPKNKKKKGNIKKDRSLKTKKGA